MDEETKQQYYLCSNSSRKLNFIVLAVHDMIKMCYGSYHTVKYRFAKNLLLFKKPDW